MTTATSSAYPRMRSLDVRRQARNGQPYVVLRDPLQLSDKMLLLPQPLAAVLAFCDGTRSPHEMAGEFSSHYGLSIGTDVVEQLLRAMDEACLLDNARAETARQQALDDYRQAPFRPPLLAGQGYPAEAEALHAHLEEYLQSASPVAPAENGTMAPSDRFGLLSPHIDYPRGGNVYAQVWQAAADAVREAELIILFGTDHYGTDPLTLTRQSYATPYGVLPTDESIVDQLAEVIGPQQAFAGELRHRGEHSLELVAVWLHHMRRRQPCMMVPILCGSFHHFVQNGASPADDPMLDQVLDLLRATTKGRRVAVVASGDLAHVGPAFGGEALDDTARAAVRAADEELMGQMQSGDAEGFFESIRRVRDRNNVCGVSPIYLTMRLLGETKGARAGYATCPADDQDSSAVSVCGMVFQ